MTHPGQELIRSLKVTAGGIGPELSIVVGAPPQSILRPVATQRNRLSQTDIRFLTVWRNRFVGSFLTEFEATEDRTASWLVNVVGPNSEKILFMVDDREGTTFGYMGLDFIDWGSRSGEVDAIVRGGAAPKGAMAASLTTLIAWARAQLGLKEIGVRVRSDNPALRFYEKIGFSEYRRTNLVKRSVPRETHWIENSVTETGSLSLVYFRYQR